MYSCDVFLPYSGYYSFLLHLLSHIKLALDLFKGYLWGKSIGCDYNHPVLPFINPKWSEQGRYDLEETVVTSYDLNKLEKQHKTAFYCFGKNGTIFGKHLIVLARTGLAPEATL